MSFLLMTYLLKVIEGPDQGWEDALLFPLVRRREGNGASQFLFFEDLRPITDLPVLDDVAEPKPFEIQHEELDLYERPRPSIC